MIKKNKHNLVKTVKEKEPLYFLINKPIEFRKNILTGAIDVIKVLEKYENFLKTRNLKRRKFHELNEKIKSTNEEVSILSGLLPGLHHKMEGLSKIEHREELASKIKKSDKVYELDREMRRIQDKISNLNF